MNEKAVAPATVKDLFKRTVSLLPPPDSRRPRFCSGSSSIARGRQGQPRPLPLSANLALVLFPPGGLYKTVCATTTVHSSMSRLTARACVGQGHRSIAAELSSRSPPRPHRESMAAMPMDSITRRFAVACGVLSPNVRTAAPAMPPAPGAVQESSNAQQLTIFYGGRVVVLDACPPEKAAELIRLAAAAQGAPPPEPEPALVDMPIARKASLRRFLVKRKDRSTAAPPEPYGSKDEEPEPPAAKKGKVAAMREEASSWLALGSLGDMHGR